MIAKKIGQKLCSSQLLPNLSKKANVEQKLQQVAQSNPEFLTGMKALSIAGVVSFNSVCVDDNPNCDYVYSLPSFGMLC